jgi:hypothetical protein
LPILEASVTSDGGKTFEGVREAASEIVNGFDDLDGDGNSDIATCSSDAFDGGVRETVSRVLTELEMRKELRIYYRKSTGEFPKRPSIAFPFTVKIAIPLIMGGDRQFPADVCLMQGDFDGDERFDLLAGRNPNELAVYLFKDGSFGEAPAAIIAVKDEDDCEIADLDGDGRSDVILRAFREQEGDAPAPCRLLLSREGPP